MSLFLKIVNHLKINIHSKSQGGGGSVAIKVGGSDSPSKPSSPDFGIDDAIKQWENEPDENRTTKTAEG
jgi:hypothetical protein